MRLYITILLCGWLSFTMWGQEPTLTFQDALRIAHTKSAVAQEAKSAYKISTLDYEIYRANLRPSLSISLTPGRYNQSIVQRYDFESNQDIYRTQQTLFSSGRLILNQQVPFTGGNVFLYSDFQSYQTFGKSGYTQFTSAPIVIGYSQQLLGYNPYKWAKRIEDKRIELARQQLAYTFEEISVNVTTLYSDALIAQKELELARDYTSNTDILLQKGEELEKLGRATHSDVLLLSLEHSQAAKQLLNATNTLKNALYRLCDYIGIVPEDSLYLISLPHPTLLPIMEKEAILQSLQNSPILHNRRLSIIEAQQIVDKTRKQRFMEATLELTVGFNQTSQTLLSAYQNPLRQDIISVGVSIPLVDWGIRKKNVQKAQAELRNATISEEEAVKQIKREVSSLIKDYNLYLQAITLAQTDIELSKRLREESQEKYLLGKNSIETVLKANQKIQASERDYLSAFKECWIKYYQIRKYTLYNWENDTPIKIINLE